MASFKRSVEVTHGESLFIAQALELYRETIFDHMDVDEASMQSEVANTIIPKFKIEIEERLG